MNRRKVLDGLLTIFPLRAPDLLKYPFVEVQIDRATERRFNDPPVLPRAAVANVLDKLDGLSNSPSTILVLTDHPRVCLSECDQDPLSEYLSKRPDTAPPVLFRGRFFRDTSSDVIDRVGSAPVFVELLDMEPQVSATFDTALAAAAPVLFGRGLFFPFALGIPPVESTPPDVYPTLPLFLAAHLGMDPSVVRTLEASATSVAMDCQDELPRCAAQLGQAYESSISSSGWMSTSGYAVAPRFDAQLEGPLIYASELTTNESLADRVVVVTGLNPSAGRNEILTELWTATAATLAAAKLDCVPACLKHIVTVLSMIVLICLRHGSDKADIAVLIYGGILAMLSFYAFRCLGVVISHVGLAIALAAVASRIVETVALTWRVLNCIARRSRAP